MVQDVVQRGLELAYGVEVFADLVVGDDTWVLDGDLEEVDRVDHNSRRVEHCFVEEVVAFEEGRFEEGIAEPLGHVCNSYHHKQVHRHDIHHHDRLDRVEDTLLLVDLRCLEEDRMDLEEVEVVDRDTFGKAQDVPC